MLDIFKGFFTWLVALNLTWWQGLLFLIVISLVIMILNYNKTKNVLRWLVGLHRKKKRSCTDCLTIILSKRHKFESLIKKIYKEQEKIENKILKNQMNFVEQKLVDMETMFIDFYNTFVYKEKINKIIIKNELVQYRMFCGLLRDGLWMRIRDEIRRSFKENGYYNIGGQEFAIYVKNQFKTIISILRRHLMNLYPPNESVVVTIDKVLEFIREVEAKIEDKTFEIYIEAKKVKIDANRKIKELTEQINVWEQKYHQELDELIEENEQ